MKLALRLILYMSGWVLSGHGKSISKSAKKALLITDFGYEVENQHSNSGPVSYPIFSLRQNQYNPEPDIRQR